MPQPGFVPGQLIEGAPRMRGRVAYCQQVPWIEAGSVRDNITFGAEFEADWCACKMLLSVNLTGSRLLRRAYDVHEFCNQESPQYRTFGATIYVFGC